MERLYSVMYAKSAKAGTRLYWEEDTADKLYYVKKGQVRISKTVDNGRTLTLYIHKAGDLFGQIDPFRNSAQIFTAEVIEDSEIGVIQQKDLEVLLWQHGDLAIEFMKWMGLMHRMTQSKFRDLLMFGKPGALCSLLIRLSNTYGVPEGDAVRIDCKITNGEMADMIGTTRESVNRMLGDMRKDNVISLQDGTITVKNIAYLRDVCSCENCPKEICRM
ncbi:MAG: Crp/Fnr family transcriptional regulator [Paenibacillaceae bacterium]|nr:Crp/Fnr family transcriptional regulator [Paenibacillus cymbidii]MBO9606832.1 Crp/Fnr family transcriptional regulator [Paenibacillaceae bacterium]